ncbi:MAG: F0F1-type ATP synthase subunit alpha [Microgenomates group bacterium Gr01-1014_7]|nr:MAG: F0F1-type ATP synthase subunit alpha [Microgenomates group bacterium Gr01-1014_7]
MDQTQEVGYVTSSRDFLVYLDGFPTIKINDMVQSDEGIRGWVNSLEEDKIEVLMLDEGKIVPKQQFIRLSSRLGVSVGDFLLGRAINPLGVPIDGKGLLSKTKTNPELGLEQAALGIESREFITEQFLTGITLIDSLIPLGKGQRELILGDAHSGKTGFLIDTIINQKNTGIICIYASIGKPAVVVRNLIDTLKNNKALIFTVIVATSSSEPAPLIFLTPKTAFTIAEYFQKKGKDVLLILDDLGTHAKIYREIALLGNKSPGRESYPGDIFYQHAHLLERAGNFLPQYGGGSITALPVIELNLNDFTTLIPTNVMSMTDGHLLFKASLRSQGQTPAIDISLSVSRVGRQTQDPVSNLLSAKIRQVLSAAADLETISRFSSELPPETQLTLRRRDLIMELLKQDPLTQVPKPIQLILLALVFTTFLQTKNQAFVEKYKATIIQAFLRDPRLMPIAKSTAKFQSDEELIKILEGAGPFLAKLCP